MNSDERKPTEYFAFPGDVPAVPGDPIARIEQYWPMRVTLKQDDLAKCPILSDEGIVVFDGVDDELSVEAAKDREPNG